VGDKLPEKFTLSVSQVVDPLSAPPALCKSAGVAVPD
jgi:hypothetical protein